MMDAGSRKESELESASTSENRLDTVEGTAVSIDSVSAVSSDVNNEVSSDRTHGSSSVIISDQQKQKKKKNNIASRIKPKEPTTPVYDSMISEFDEYAGNASHGYEVGDMVWGKVKSHPWWPGHIFSENFATASVRRSKRDGLLLVAFFGDSSYGWFDPSEVIPFDSNFADKSRQTNSKTFVKAVEEAMDEVSRRSALGLSCMCRSKHNFRQTDAPGHFAVDVIDYEPGAVYSLDAIGKARDAFQPNSALDFVRRLALEPTGSENDGIDFIKYKAKVISYRRAVYEEFDETYAQAFGYDSVRPSSGSIQEPDSRKTPSKAPLSGRQVFADTSGKGKSSVKSNKLKEHAKKDKYLFKRRDEPKEVKAHQKKVKDKVTSSSQPHHNENNRAGDYVLQKRVSHDDLPTKDLGATVEDDNKVVDDNDHDKIIMSKVEDNNTTSDVVVDKSSTDKRAVTQNDIPISGPHNKTSASDNAADDMPKMVKKVSKRPVGERGSSEKKKKRRKEQLIADGTGNISLLDKDEVSAKKHLQSSIEDFSNSNETELRSVLGDLFLLALDPFHAINRGRLVETRQVFLKFRSLVFKKSLDLSLVAEDDEGNSTTHLIKSQSSSLGKPEDPSIGGRKRGPSDRQEDMAARKKKKVGEIRNLTKEKKLIKKIDDSPIPGKQTAVVVKTLKKPGSELVKKKTEQRAPPDPTMLTIKFPQGGSLPSTNELKARFARFGPMDHSATRILWKTYACRVVYWHKAHAEAARRFVVGSSSLFGNTDVKVILKDIGSDREPAVAVKVPKEEYQPGMEDRAASSMAPATSGIQLKSILKKSGGEEAAGNGGKGRVKFMLGGEENQMKNNTEKRNGASSFSKSHSTMDINSKNFQKAVLQSSSPLPPLLPLPTSTSAISSTTQFTRPPPPPQPKNFMQYVTPPPRLPPPPSLSFPSEMAEKTPLAVTPEVDISHQMLSLLTKCNEVVADVTNIFGYVPYRPL